MASQIARYLQNPRKYPAVLGDKNGILYVFLESDGQTVKQEFVPNKENGDSNPLTEALKATAVTIKDFEPDLLFGEMNVEELKCKNTFDLPDDVKMKDTTPVVATVETMRVATSEGRESISTNSFVFNSSHPVNYALIHEGTILHEIQKELGKRKDIYYFHGFTILPVTIGSAVKKLARGFMCSDYAIELVHHKPTKKEDIDKVKTGVDTALKALHAKGFAHNDITPECVGLDHNNNPILINFHSAARIGEEIAEKKLKHGTQPWVPAFTHSSDQNDKTAFEKLCEWLDGKIEYPSGKPVAGKA